MKPTAQRRRDRRALLDNLLGRMLRGRLSAAEAALLAESVREEQRAYDQTRRSLGETTAALTRNREAADTAVQEQEERAKDAEKRLAGYVAVFGPHAVDDFHAWQHRAKRAEAALDRVRDAQRLGDALATVAEYDGLTPEAARANAAFAEAANSTEARLAEQAREHAIDLAVIEKRAISAEQALGLAEFALGRVRAARTFGEVWATLGMYYRMTPEEAGREARARRTEADRRTEKAEQRATEAEHKANRYRTVWLAARRDRRADRAAMAAELPFVQAGREALAARCRFARTGAPACPPGPCATCDAKPARQHGACGCGRTDVHLNTPRCH